MLQEKGSPSPVTKRSDRLRSLARRLLPAGVRKLLREARRELPVRARDLPADLREALIRAEDRLPPARLRRRVGLTSSRAEFLEVGERAAADVLRVYRAAAPAGGGFGAWLDFGCGSGRVLRHLRRAGVADLSGVDVDRGAIRWLQRRHGRESFVRSPERPPLPFPGESFDVVVAVSVFSHLDEPVQLEWLEESARLLRPGGLLIATTHGPDLLVTRDDLTADQLERFAATGFLFAPGGGPFNEASAFHSAEYLKKTWGSRLDPVVALPRGLGGYQDLSVWRRPAASEVGQAPRAPE